jgi:sec-independent protein translocase protein TatA
VRLENPFFWIILAVVALIIFGPKRLPELGEGLGKAIREFRKHTTDMTDTLRAEASRPETATGTTYTPPAEATPPSAAPAAPPVVSTPPEPPQA